MAITKEKLDLLKDLDPTDKAEILGLIDGVKTKDSEIAELKKKVPSDAHEIVAKTDHAKLKSTIEERDKKIQELDTKLSELTSKKQSNGFPDIFDLIG